MTKIVSPVSHNHCQSGICRQPGICGRQTNILVIWGDDTRY